MAGRNVATAVANNHVFDATSDGKINVYDLAGRHVATVQDAVRTGGLSVSPDGTAVYATLEGTDGVAVINSSTLTESTRYAKGSLTGSTYRIGKYLFLTEWSGTNTWIYAFDSTNPASTGQLVPAAGTQFHGVAPGPITSGSTVEFYTSTCITGESSTGCELDLDSYDGASFTTLASLNVPSGNWVQPVGYDSAKNMFLTEDTHHSNTLTVRDPATLAATVYMPASLYAMGTTVVSDHVVAANYDPAFGDFTALEVRDLDGTLTYSLLTAGHEILPVTAPGVDAVYAVDLMPDWTTYFVVLPDSALMEPTAPTAPTAVLATAAAHGRIKITWKPSVLTANNAPTAYSIFVGTNGSAATYRAQVNGDTTSYLDSGNGLATGGRYDFRVVANNTVGTATSALADVVVDAIAPTVRQTAPAAGITQGKSLALSYSASDPTSGIANYDVRYRSGAWNAPMSGYIYPATWQARTSTSASLPVSPGHEYCWSIRARDNAGNVSGWTTDRCNTVPLDDRSLTALGAGWVRTSDSAAFEKTVTRTKTAGARLRVNGVHFRQADLIVTTCPRCGHVKIFLNGTAWRTVNTHSATTKRRSIIKLPKVSLRTATITLKALDESHKVIIDGLAVIST